MSKNMRRKVTCNACSILCVRNELSPEGSKRARRSFNDGSGTHESIHEDTTHARRENASAALQRLSPLVWLSVRPSAHRAPRARVEEPCAQSEVARMLPHRLEVARMPARRQFQVEIDRFDIDSALRMLLFNYKHPISWPAPVPHHAKERCHGCGLWKDKQRLCSFCESRPNRAQAVSAMVRSASEPSISPDPYVHKIPMPHPQQRASALALARAVRHGRLSRHPVHRSAPRFDAYEESDDDEEASVDDPEGARGGKFVRAQASARSRTQAQAQSMARAHAQSLSRISSSAETRLVQRPATASADSNFAADERWVGSGAHGRCVVSSLSAASTKRLSSSSSPLCSAIDPYVDSYASMPTSPAGSSAAALRLGHELRPGPPQNSNQHPKMRCPGCGLWKWKSLECPHCASRNNHAAAQTTVSL